MSLPMVVNIFVLQENVIQPKVVHHLCVIAKKMRIFFYKYVALFGAPTCREPKTFRNPQEPPVGDSWGATFVSAQPLVSVLLPP
jgi:hypothetical protein